VPLDVTFGHHFHARRVAHSTNTVHQYSANPVRTCSSKAISPLWDVPSQAYRWAIAGPLSASKVLVKKGAEPYQLDRSYADFREVYFDALG
jgi:hypothetical protein